jgi:hypothetical protein
MSFRRTYPSLRMESPSSFYNMNRLHGYCSMSQDGRECLGCTNCRVVAHFSILKMKCDLIGGLLINLAGDVSEFVLVPRHDVPPNTNKMIKCILLQQFQTFHCFFCNINICLVL